MKIPSFCRFVKIVIFIPRSQAEILRETMAEAGAGKLGEYDVCSFSVKGIGRFRPSKKANPFLGKRGKIVKVAEERIEMLCEKKNMTKVLRAIRKVHPYEEPAIEVYPLLYP